MMKSKKAKRVVIALRLSTQAGQRTLQGIYRYLTENRIHWDVRIKRDSDEFGLANVARYPKWGIDGIIFGMCAPDDRLDTSIAEIAGQKAPIVAVDVRNERPLDERRKNIAFVNTDAVSVGKEAADFFMRHGGYQSFGYVPDFRGRIWGKLRGDAFVAELKSKGFECSCYVHPPLDKDNSEDFRRWLRLLRKPAALFVACDDQALTVVEACRNAKLRIPRDISVLGVDDDEIIDESCDPTLSSVRPNHERQGFIAAMRLRDMMAGETDVPRHTEIPIQNISARSSTRNESPAGVLVQGALAYIAKNFQYGLDPSAVAHHFKVSRRLLDLRFREITGTSVNAAIREQQLSDVCNRLKHSKIPIEKIAGLCGFANSSYLKTLFKSRFGMTMREWRTQHTQK
jgi:LacI family transcriptional regulator